ncbi:MAG TPA: MoxR family ATPase [Candidatus Deferrimicrobiaceae bacterium]|jgi:MoxR-like ATPase
MMTFDDARTLIGLLEANVTAVLLGKKAEVTLTLASFLAGGHILLDDIPGTGKTTLARAIAAAISGTFRRIQFTSDILPQDVTGVHVFDAARHDFTFSPGPLFANIVLADEINRGNPRAQSALLEAMSERQVTIDNRTYPLPDPFLVIATQNPQEQYGTYPLPESQLDRFNMRLRLSYPDRESELRLIRESTLSAGRDGAGPVLTPGQLRDLRAVACTVTVAEPIVSYIYRIVAATRAHPAIRTGASPRGAIGLKATAQALALLSGRDHVIPEDIRHAAPPVLSHRILLPGAGDGGPVGAEAGDALLREIVDIVPPPA